MRKSRNLTIIFSAGSMLFMIGCETFTPPMQHVPLSEAQSTVLSMNSNRRISYVFLRPDTENEGKMRPIVVSEPPPDTALQQTVELVGKLTAGAKLTGEASFKDTQTIVNLTQRTQAIVILRDSLFRLAEARANGFIKDPEWLKQYEDVLDIAKEIALFERRELEQEQAKLETAKTNLSEAVAVKEAAKIALESSKQDETNLEQQLAVSSIERQNLELQLAKAQKESEAKIAELNRAKSDLATTMQQLTPLTQQIDALRSQIATARIDQESIVRRLDGAAAAVITQSRPFHNIDLSGLLDSAANSRLQIEALKSVRASLKDEQSKGVIDKIIADKEGKSGK
jgi:hypothetical protein